MSIFVEYTGNTQYYGSEHAAGLDLVAQDGALLFTGSAFPFNTGFKVAIPQGYCGEVRCRSSLGKMGIIIAGGVGTIDSDYRGDIIVPLILLDGFVPVKINKGDRIAQLVFTVAERAILLPVKKLPTTVRGDGGFGSTGR